MPSDILLEIISPRIDGESRDHKHPNTIEVQSCNFGVAQETSMQAGAGLVGGGSSFNAFSIAKQLDCSSIKLFQHCVAGAKIDSAKLYFRRPAEGGATATSNEPVDYLDVRVHRSSGDELRVLRQQRVGHPRRAHCLQRD